MKNQFIVRDQIAALTKQLKASKIERAQILEKLLSYMSQDSFVGMSEKDTAECILAYIAPALMHGHVRHPNKLSTYSDVNPNRYFCHIEPVTGAEISHGNATVISKLKHAKHSLENVINKDFWKAYIEQEYTTIGLKELQRKFKKLSNTRAIEFLQTYDIPAFIVYEPAITKEKWVICFPAEHSYRELLDSRYF